MLGTSKHKLYRRRIILLNFKLCGGITNYGFDATVTSKIDKNVFLK